MKKKKKLLTNTSMLAKEILARKEKEATALENMRILQKQNPYAGFYDTLKKDPLRDAIQPTDDEAVMLAESLRKIFTMGASSSRPPDPIPLNHLNSKDPNDENSPMEGITGNHLTETRSMVTNPPNLSQ